MIKSIGLYIESMTINDSYLILGAFLTAIYISYLAIPVILKVAKMKNLYDEPNGRTSHLRSTPTLGGVAIFASVMLSIMIFVRISGENYLQYLVAGLTIIFFIGVKDDIILISASKKFLGQIIASLILIILGNIRINSLFGLFGLFELAYISSVVISLLMYLIVINCFNLIDGVDGLASGMGIFSSSFLAIWLYLNGHYEAALISASLLGSLIPFFFFNVFGVKNKLFMGDTGSMIIGFMISVLLILFMNFNIHPDLIFGTNGGTPVIAAAIIFIPIFDMVRVFIIRILNRVSPFVADKNHLHHFLLNLKFSHFQTTLTLLFVNISVLILVYILRHWGVFKLGVLLLLLGLLLSLVIKVLKRKNIE